MKRITLTTVLPFIASAAMLALPILVFADDKFVPLTSLPGVTSVSASAISLPSFINNLYRISIGIAAFFAVVQIVWAGYLFMSSADSISKNTKARQKIMNAVIGLVLVLSPFVVFSIINPKILDISLNFASLKSTNGTGGNVNTNFGAGTATSSTNNPGNQSGTGGEAATPKSCTDAGFTNIKAIQATSCSSLGANYTNVAPTCCSATLPSGSICCGNASNL